MNFNEPNTYSFVQDLQGNTFVFKTEKYSEFLKMDPNSIIEVFEIMVEGDGYNIIDKPINKLKNELSPSWGAPKSVKKL